MSYRTYFRKETLIVNLIWMGSYLATLRRFFLMISEEEEDDSAINYFQATIDLKLKAIAESYYITFIPAIKSDLALIHRWLLVFRSGVTLILDDLNRNNAKETIAELKLMLIPPPVFLSDALGDTMRQHQLHPLMDNIFWVHPLWKHKEDLKVFEILREGHSLMTLEFSCIRRNLIMALWEATVYFEEVEEPLLLPEIEKTIEELKSNVTKFNEEFVVYRSKFNYFEIKFMRMISKQTFHLTFDFYNREI